jgi:hypothetical protein
MLTYDTDGDKQNSLKETRSAAVIGTIIFENQTISRGITSRSRSIF